MRSAPAVPRPIRAILFAFVAIVGGVSSPVVSAQDLIYYHLRGPADPSPSPLPGANQGHIVRLDPATGLFDVVSGVVSLGTTPPSWPHGYFTAYTRDPDGTFFIYSPAETSRPKARVYRLRPGERRLELYFEATPSLMADFGNAEFMHTPDDVFVLISRFQGKTKRFFGIMDVASRTFKISSGVSTSATSVDLVAHTYLTIADDRTKVERVQWDTGERVFLGAIDPAAFGAYEMLFDVAYYQPEKLLVILQPNNSVSRQAFLVDYSASPATVLTEGFPGVNRAISYRLRDSVGPFVLFGNAGDRFWVVDTRVADGNQRSLTVPSQATYSRADRTVYIAPSRVLQESPTQYYDVITGLAFDLNFFGPYNADVRLDFMPTVLPATRGGGPPLPLPDSSQLYSGPDGTLLLHTGGQLYRIYLATGDRVMLSETYYDIEHSVGTVGP